MDGFGILRMDFSVGSSGQKPGAGAFFLAGRVVVVLQSVPKIACLLLL